MPETVLVMQGGGSLGAYECGVYKVLEEHRIKFDIIAGTSIGAVNAAIISSPKNGEPAESLEQFWLDVAEGPAYTMLPNMLAGPSIYATLYGNPKIFLPVWLSQQSSVRFPTYKLPPYLYEIKPLQKTLEKYVEFSKLGDSGLPRLIVTTTDIQKCKPVIFDSRYMEINAKHITACAGFPFYGISWTEIDGRYLWDGSLLSNTPLREVIDVSPKNDKRVYIINVFPRRQKDIPQDLLDSWHRARDIIYADKTAHNMRMSKVISRQLILLNKMHDLLCNAKLDERSEEEFRKIEQEYHKLAEERGAIIEQVTRIERTEEAHSLFEDTDFSAGTIKNLIKQGENDARKVLSST